MSKKFTIFAILSCVCLISANLFEMKTFSVGVLTLTGGFLIFPISYLLNSFITEIYGFEKAKFVILTAFAVNVGFVALSQIVRILPPADIWEGEEHFNYVFNTNIRFCAASMAAFVCGSFVNALLQNWTKERENGRHFFLRTCFTIFSAQIVDSCVFFPIAFWGVGTENVLRIMIPQVILKTLFAIVLLPIVAIIVKRMKQTESQ